MARKLRSSVDSSKLDLPEISDSDDPEAVRSTRARERVEWRDIGAVLGDVAEDYATQELLPEAPGDESYGDESDPRRDPIFTQDGLKRELRKLIRDEDVPIREKRQAISDLARICGFDASHADVDITRLTNRELAEAFRDRVLPVIQLFASVTLAEAPDSDMVEGAAPRIGDKVDRVDRDDFGLRIGERDDPRELAEMGGEVEIE